MDIVNKSDFVAHPMSFDENTFVNAESTLATTLSAIANGKPMPRSGESLTNKVSPVGMAKDKYQVPYKTL